MTIDNYYSQVEKFIIDACKKSDYEELINHFRRTTYWIKKLKPSADDALLIAGLSHDIERIFRKKQSTNKNKTPKKFTDYKKLKYHQEKSAEIIAEFLERQKAPRKLIDRVKVLVSRHEWGGNEDQNLLRDADSVSFLENNIGFFVTGMVVQRGKDQVRKKFDWMFKRITLPEAKKIAKPMYEKATKLLESS